MELNFYTQVLQLIFFDDIISRSRCMPSRDKTMHVRSILDAELNTKVFW